MAAFGYTGAQIWKAVGEKGDDDVTKPWVEILPQPKRRPKWTAEAIDWIQARIENNAFQSHKLFDNLDDVLREISTLYLRAFAASDVDGCRKLLELSAKVLKTRDGGKDAANNIHQTVVFNGESPERAALYERIKTFGSPIPGGPQLGAGRLVKEAISVTVPEQPEHGVDGVDVHPAQDSEQVG